VGVGISGEEGLQAVNSSDYAIAQVNPFGHNANATQTAYFGLVTVPFPQTFDLGAWALVICTKREHVSLFLHSVIVGHLIQSNRILNFFYKNIVCIGVLWWFQIYCFWSST
jgi:phospholipid-translocating ATPase